VAGESDTKIVPKKKRQDEPIIKSINKERQWHQYTHSTIITWEKEPITDWIKERWQEGSWTYSTRECDMSRQVQIYKKKLWQWGQRRVVSANMTDGVSKIWHEPKTEGCIALPKILKTCRLSLPKIIFFHFRKNIRYHYRKFRLKYRWRPTGNHCLTCIWFVNLSMFTFCSLIPNQICFWNHGDNTLGNEKGK
jgi:hypothetical protein